MVINKKLYWNSAVGIWAFLVGAAAVGAARPNVVFVMLDDLGYAQVEAFGRGLSAEDCDPKLLAHVEEQADYSLDEAMRLMKKATPTLSRMADGGVRFNNAFACSNLCAPSRIGVSTGVLQNRWGIYRNIDTEAHGLKPNSHLAEKLQELGYATAHIGKWHVGSHDKAMVHRYLEKHKVPNPEQYTYWTMGKYWSIHQELKRDGYEGSTAPKDHALNNGFDYYFGYNQWECPFYKANNVWEGFRHAGVIQDYNTDVFTDKALAFMEKSLGEKKPFYVQLHYHAVHSPLDPKAPAKYYDRFDSGSKTLNNFYAHVFGVDENVRRIFQWLEEKGVAENTLLVFTSDNGGAVGGKSCLPGNAPYVGHKGMMHLGGFRVPLFFHWPVKINQPLGKEQLVSTLDILPTIIDAAGGMVPPEIDGKSLLPQILENSEARVRDHLAIGGIHARVWAFNGATSFFEHNESREKAPSGYIVADDRYVLRFVSETVSNLYKDAVDGIPAHYELYDYRADPGERNNLIDAMPEKAGQLKSIWKRESAAYPKPVRWETAKWKAIMNP
ncbi:sulfatase family protein [Pontiella desulfatans]|nr:sulfatase-like hydrolase/transferase [Pontiella desulfatans]